MTSRKDALSWSGETIEAAGDAASPSPDDVLRRDAWTLVAKRHPEPHTKYVVRRDGAYFTATPCYGMHAPWWVVRVMGNKYEHDPVQMADNDEWVALVDFDAAIRESQPSKEGDDTLLKRLTSPEVIDRAARTMARMVYGFGHAESIKEYTSPEFQREHVKIAGYVIHAAIIASLESLPATREL